MAELTKKDLDVLCDALEAWEQKDAGAGLFSGLMANILFKDAPPETQAEVEKMKKERTEKREQEQRERKEISIMLRAKLISMKQQAIFDEATKIVSGK